MIDELTAAERERVLVLTREFDAPRELVFNVWTTPAHLANWWGPTGFTLAACTQDFRPGGAYRICMRSPEGEDHWVSGVYREIDRPARIAFTWVREDAEGRPTTRSVVTVTFDEASDDQRTAFTLRQVGFPSDEERDAHRGGWSECLVRLAEYASAQKH